MGGTFAHHSLRCQWLLRWHTILSSSPIQGAKITTLLERQHTALNIHYCFLSRRICLNHLVGMMAKAAKVALPFMGWPSCCIRGVLICFGQWMTILNSRVDLAIRNGHVDGCFKSLLIWPGYKQPVVNPYSHFRGNLKGTSKTLVNLKSLHHFWFSVHTSAKEARLGGTDVCVPWLNAK